MMMIVTDYRGSRWSEQRRQADRFRRFFVPADASSSKSHVQRHRHVHGGGGRSHDPPGPALPSTGPRRHEHRSPPASFEDVAVGFENEATAEVGGVAECGGRLLLSRGGGSHAAVDEAQSFDEIARQIDSLTRTVNDLKLRRDRRPLALQRFA